jgi:hypothetical protein
VRPEIEGDDFSDDFSDRLPLRQASRAPTSFRLA